MMFNNQQVPMTRRYPKLPPKQLRRDAKIASDLILAWDVYHDADKVFEIFWTEKDNLSSERYWELLRTVWIIAGSLSKVHLFRQLMQSKKPNRHYFSTKEESNFLRSLPETFEVHRACILINDEGISWTLDKKYAEWYRDKYKKRQVVTREVNRADVFAYVDRNKEHEIIIL